MDADLAIKVIGVGIALSGWVKVYIDYIANKPKITGRMLTVMKGSTYHDGREQAFFFPYLYLLNSRKNVMHLLDYELYLKISGQWHRLSRVYGMEKTGELNFFGKEGKKLVANNFKDNLIYMKNSPVQHGVPLHGWIAFSGLQEFYQADIQGYKVICIDAGFERHTIITKSSEMFGTLLVSQIADITIPDDF